MINLFAGKHGIEIGGPSSLFLDSIPIYRQASGIDGVNFSASTVWEGEIKEGETYKTPGREIIGHQYISDGTDMRQIKSDLYDFLISSDCLEHIANPLKALLEWARIIKNQAPMLLVLPNKVQNFDNKRPFTTFEHILQDFNQNIGENDLTHLPEVLSLHDLPLDPAAGTFENFTRRSLDNFNNRCIHHHVFHIPLIEIMLNHVGFEVQDIQENPISFTTLAIKKG